MTFAGAAFGMRHLRHPGNDHHRLVKLQSIPRTILQHFARHYVAQHSFLRQYRNACNSRDYSLMDHCMLHMQAFIRIHLEVIEILRLYLRLYCRGVLDT